MKVLKHISLFTFFCVIMFSCENNSDTSIEGKYYNEFEKNAIHYIDLKKDSSFVHYYLNKVNGEEVEHKGTWSKRVTKKDEIKVSFKNWEDFGPYADNKKTLIRSVKLDGNELVFSYDLRKEMNFYKKD